MGKKRDCGACDGLGRVLVRVRPFFGEDDGLDDVACRPCFGTGKVTTDTIPAPPPADCEAA